MNKLIPITALLLVTLTMSCGVKKKNADGTPSAQNNTVVLPPTAEPSFFEGLPTDGTPFMLSPQVLTSLEAVKAAFTGGGETDYYIESTPVEKTFFFPEEGVRQDSSARFVQLFHNYHNVINRIIHSYEWVCRQPDGFDEEKSYSLRDTISWIDASRPRIPESLVRKAIPDPIAAKSANRILSVYRNFQGEDKFVEDYREFLSLVASFPEFVSDKELDEFTEGFWKWYDKAQTVRGIDEITKMHMKGSKERPDSLQIQRLKDATLKTRDIDERAILALELVQFDREEGVVLLGDIMESGLYTKYLLEVWISWRANVQMEHSPSSFSVIANNYYDRLKVKCLNTLLRHLQEPIAEEDPEEHLYVKCLLYNMLNCDILSRYGSISGNASLAVCMRLAYNMFIHPRLLEN